MNVDRDILTVVPVHTQVEQEGISDQPAEIAKRETDLAAPLIVPTAGPYCKLCPRCGKQCYVTILHSICRCSSGHTWS